MDINNTDVTVAVQDSLPTEVSIPQVIPSKPSVKTDIIKNLKPADNQKPSESHSLSAKEAEQVADDLNMYMSGLQTNMRFSISEKFNHQVIIKITNKDTDELIKQIPSEELIKIREKMEELTGLIFDDKI